ncbi:MAG: hypothetical protein EAX86_07750 [Candidatus Heimdallarchaeota archaeon]|nr:hypothetical protein [Candidatus Heimdallarchaeota archaeon]
MGLLISGIDEAGRGSLVGPLIIAGISLDQENLKQISKLGLKDSKLFNGVKGERKRAKLSSIIEEKATELEIIEIQAQDIDVTLDNRPHDNLNLLELRHFADIIFRLDSSEIIIDNLSTPKYSYEVLMRYFQEKSPDFRSKILFTDSKCIRFSIKNEIQERIIKISKKADRDFPIVSAASCVAKTHRDSKLREIEAKWNLPNYQLGRGYPNPADTNIIEFLQEYSDKIYNRKYPFIRYKWNWPPLQLILQRKKPKLDNFFKNK